jgi:2-polyprenyl-3-methyl-5-hydroxy-6-metoxy-1,4-benzoquinol methylase
MTEINLMERYPTGKKNLDRRAVEKTEGDRAIARQFGKEFFDGERKYGYGGYNYHPRFWTGVVEDLIKHYHLTNESKIFDIGCAKGFMLYDFTTALPGIKVRGIDISEYAIQNAKEEIKQFTNVGDAKDLSKFSNKEFDLVTSIITLHNLEKEECKKTIKDIERIGKNAFITLDAWKNEEQKKNIFMWNLTAKTIMSTEDWKNLFGEVGYTGDYYWSIIE